jgi:transcriptional regulator GlxA family with amidase domain
MLSREDPRVDVTRVALGLGFGHVGRFAALYRQAFGESPSETLRRARRARATARTGAVPRLPCLE